MKEQLRAACRKLLDEGTVKVVIGYDAEGRPAIITAAEETGRLDYHNRCFSNLTAYLKRKEVRELGKPAVVVKACDARSLVILEQEAQIERGAVYAIGMACDGVGSPKCAHCETRTPQFTDETIGKPSDAPPAAGPANLLEQLMAKTPAERMAFWKNEFSRCVKCYACRQVCPMCYCNRCVADKNRPTTIDTSATLKGNFAWHITRAFHLAGRCAGCGECTRACPAGIPLGVLNQTLAIAAQQEFGYRAGAERGAPPLIGAFAPGDKEGFIR